MRRSDPRVPARQRSRKRASDHGAGDSDRGERASDRGGCASDRGERASDHGGLERASVGARRPAGSRPRSAGGRPGVGGPPSESDRRLVGGAELGPNARPRSQDAQVALISRGVSCAERSVARGWPWRASALTTAGSSADPARSRARTRAIQRLTGAIAGNHWRGSSRSSAEFKRENGESARWVTTSRSRGPAVGRLLGSSRGDRALSLKRRRSALAGPLDAVLDDPALERVTGDSEQAGRFDNAAGGGEGFLAEEAFGFVELVAFEVEAHASSIGKDPGPAEDENVFGLHKKSSTQMKCHEAPMNSFGCFRDPVDPCDDRSHSSYMCSMVGYFVASNPVISVTLPQRGLSAMVDPPWRTRAPRSPRSFRAAGDAGLRESSR
jgi:hypothetical protein